MIGTEQIQSIIGGTAHDASGAKIGKVGQVYLDDESGLPTWATVSTGLFGTSETFVPLDRASVDGTSLRLPYPREAIADAPKVAADGHIAPSEEADLYRYYGLDSAADPERGTQGHDPSGPTTEHAMTLSEERLQVGKETREAGRARLRKYVVTEQQSVTVPVSREKATLTHEPITEANLALAMDGPEITEAEHEIVLHEEVAVAAKEAVPVERVKLATRTVTEQVEVSEQVRKERVEIDGDTTTRTDNRR